MPKVREQPWSNNARKGIVEGKPLNPSAAIEARYYTTLRVLIDRMIADTDHELKKLFKTEHAEEYFAQDASVSSQARILTNALIKKYTDLFASLSKPTAERFADESDQSSDIAVKSSIRHLSDQLTLSTKTITSGPLNDILNATITENVALIKSIPAQYLSGVQQAVMRSITTGNGMADLVPYLQKQKGITLRRARMISTDQTRKAFNSLSKARMEKIGVTSYIWRHTAGSRHPRKQHIEMSGNVYRYDDPPVIDDRTGERGIPGQAINCACRMQPVLIFSEDE
ncbi:phage minor head protein [Fimbriiglobus ruber]|uniref:Plasmid-related protein n=1 Tax=Fimbriiglobus ruber TaxID=1908690 RepID=A0A225DRB9_9BACT|nr:phage minor head protein [Fimbriiglobus ruber]OWK42184.1 Plasmid-related protein [Fimbriiglobus ruber]